MLLSLAFPSAAMKSIVVNRLIRATGVFVLALAALLEAQVPVVRKVEPPNWWVNYTPTLTLMLTGENLKDTRVRSSTKGIRVVDSEASANGHYLFVHLKLSSALKAGAGALRLTTPTGTTTCELPLQARDDPRGYFEGFSRDDVIYLIMPDRF